MVLYFIIQSSYICLYHGATIVQELGTRQERKEMRKVTGMNMPKSQVGVVMQQY
jgi:hypothetical protein